MAHNGYGIQANIGANQYQGDYRYLNRVLDSQNWYSNVPPDPSKHDSNGWMTTFYGNGVYSRCYIPSQSDRPGNYVVKWTGNGTIYIGAAHSIVSGSLSGSNGRCVISTSATTIDYGISAITTPITALVICHVDDEAAIDAGSIFTAEFKDKFGRFGVLRPLGALAINEGNTVRTWADRTPSTHWSSADQYKSTYYAGVTGGTDDNYTATLGGFSLTDGATVHVTYDRTSTGYTPTLNVSGTGAKAIKDAYGQTIAYDVRKPTINRMATLIYDSVMDAWINTGGDTEWYDRGVSGGMAVEWFVQLCNEVGAHPWFLIPHHAADPFSDYSASLAQYCKDNLAAGLIPRFEISNEVWNTANGYPQTNWAIARETARGTASDYVHEWYGRATAKLGKAVSTVYADDRTKYQVICGVQAYGGTTAQAKRLTSPAYVTETGVPGDAARYWVTHLSPANYWHVNFPEESAATDVIIQAYADEWATAGASRKTELIDAYFALDGNGTIAMLQTWADYADSYGLGLTFYEGGFDASISAGDTNLDNFMRAVRFSDKLRYRTHEYYRAIRAMGGEYPSEFILTGSAENDFSIYTTDIYSEPSKRWDAVLEANQGFRIFNITTG
jgi:hypothetical protein